MAACFADFRRDGEVERDEALANATLFAAAQDLLDALEEARTGLLWLAFSAVFFVCIVAIAAWDLLRAAWDTLVLGKSEQEQLRDYIDTE